MKTDVIIAGKQTEGQADALICIVGDLFGIPKGTAGEVWEALAPVLLATSDSDTIQPGKVLALEYQGSILFEAKHLVVVGNDPHLPLWQVLMRGLGAVERGKCKSVRVQVLGGGVKEMATDWTGYQVKQFALAARLFKSKVVQQITFVVHNEEQAVDLGVDVMLRRELVAMQVALRKPYIGKAVLIPAAALFVLSIIAGMMIAIKNRSVNGMASFIIFTGLMPLFLALIAHIILDIILPNKRARKEIQKTMERRAQDSQQRQVN